MPSVERPGGRTVAYEVKGAGEGPPVLLNAALYRDRTSWDFQLPALEAGMRCVVIDQEGTGESPFGGGEVSVQSLADDAAAVAAALGEERLHVAGVSMGAAVAMTFVADRPEQVESLLLVTPWARADTHLRMCFQIIADLVEYAPTLVPSEAATTWLLFSRGLLDQLADVDAEVAARVDSPAFPTREAALAHLRAATAWDAGERLARITAPTLVVGGAGDQLVPVAHAREVAAEIPAAELRILEGEGATHGLAIEMTEELNALIKTFYDL